MEIESYSELFEYENTSEFMNYPQPTFPYFESEPFRPLGEIPEFFAPAAETTREEHKTDELILPIDDAEKSSRGLLHSRDSLKFGRKLIKLMKKHLKSSSSFVSKYLKVSGEIITSIIVMMGYPEPIIEDVVHLQRQMLQKSWEQFKNCLSYHRNKKICVVKSEYWNVMFCSKTFVDLALQAPPSTKESYLVDFIFKNEGLSRAFCQILFLINKLIVLSLVLKDDTDKGGRFLRSINTCENLIVLAVEPRLYESYNQRSGKFANECCGKCKVCKSKAIPSNIDGLLREARLNANFLVKSILEIIPKSLDTVQDDQLFSLMYILVQS